MFSKFIFIKQFISYLPLKLMEGEAREPNQVVVSGGESIYNYGPTWYLSNLPFGTEEIKFDHVTTKHLGHWSRIRFDELSIAGFPIEDEYANVGRCDMQDVPYDYDNGWNGTAKCYWFIRYIPTLDKDTGKYAPLHILDEYNNTTSIRVSNFGPNIQNTTGHPLTSQEVRDNGDGFVGKLVLVGTQALGFVSSYLTMSSVVAWISGAIGAVVASVWLGKTLFEKQELPKVIHEPQTTTEDVQLKMDYILHQVTDMVISDSRYPDLFWEYYKLYRMHESLKPDVFIASTEWESYPGLPLPIATTTSQVAYKPYYDYDGGDVIYPPRSEPQYEPQEPQEPEQQPELTNEEKHELSLTFNILSDYQNFMRTFQLGQSLEQPLAAYTESYETYLQAYPGKHPTNQATGLAFPTPDELDELYVHGSPPSISDNKEEKVPTMNAIIPGAALFSTLAAGATKRTTKGRLAKYVAGIGGVGALTMLRAIWEWAKAVWPVGKTTYTLLQMMDEPGEFFKGQASTNPTAIEFRQFFKELINYELYTVIIFEAVDQEYTKHSIDMMKIGDDLKTLIADIKGWGKDQCINSFKLALDKMRSRVNEYSELDDVKEEEHAYVYNNLLILVNLLYEFKETTKLLESEKATFDVMYDILKNDITAGMIQGSIPGENFKDGLEAVQSSTRREFTPLKAKKTAEDFKRYRDPKTGQFAKKPVTTDIPNRGVNTSFGFAQILNAFADKDSALAFERNASELRGMFLNNTITIQEYGEKAAELQKRFQTEVNSNNTADVCGKECEDVITCDTRTADGYDFLGDIFKGPCAPNLNNIWGLLATQQYMRAFKGMSFLGVKGYPWLLMGGLGKIGEESMHALMKYQLMKGVLGTNIYKNSLFERTYDIQLKLTDIPFIIGKSSIKGTTAVHEINLMHEIELALKLYSSDENQPCAVQSPYFQIKGFRFAIMFNTSNAQGEEEPDQGYRALLVNGHPKIQQEMQQIASTNPLRMNQNKTQTNWWVLDKLNFFQAPNPLQLPRVLCDVKGDFTSSHALAFASSTPIYWNRNHATTGPSPITGKANSQTGGEGLHLLIGTNSHKSNVVTVSIEGWFSVSPAPFFGQILSEPILDKHLSTRIPVTWSKTTSDAFNAQFEPARTSTGGKLVGKLLKGKGKLSLKDFTSRPSNRKKKFIIRKAKKSGVGTKKGRAIKSKTKSRKSKCKKKKSKKSKKITKKARKAKALKRAKKRVLKVIHFRTSSGKKAIRYQDPKTHLFISKAEAKKRKR